MVSATALTILVVLCTVIGVSVTSSQLRGVNPTLSARYSADSLSMISCGGGALSSVKINDDYCDCASDNRLVDTGLSESSSIER